MTHSTRARVMLTGASGFVGRACTRALVAAGHDVHAVSSRAHGEAAGAVTWHRYDLLDPAACAAAVAAIRPTHLLHLAWIATPGVFWRSRANLQWLAAGVSLIDEFYRQGGARALGVGTCAEYEWTPGDSREASTPLRPETIYGRCKLALGLAFEAAARIHCASAAWARLFFPYGPGEAGDRLIPAVIRGLLCGEVVDCTHGRQVRDFVFVDDVAAALTALLCSAEQGAFNVGSGQGLSLREVIAVITAQLDRADLVRFGAREAPPGDPQRVVADITCIGARVGWRPAVSIEDGIRRSIAAWRQRLVDEGSMRCRS